MVESIVRAERPDPQSSISASFVWEVPRKPVSVRIPFEFIDRLEREAVESFRSLTSRGSEIGGLLLGRVAPGSPAVVAIEDYLPVPCDYSRGPLYRLSEADLARFERAIEQHGGPGAARVAGFFRSHTRKGLSLDAEDAAFFQARFRAPHHIALLVRPAATKASVAGIFIREGDTVHTEASYLEFLFRSADLQPSRTAAEPAPRPAGPPPVEPPPAPKPAARGQIVPIAFRRDPEPPSADSTAHARPSGPPPVGESARAAEPPPAPLAATKPAPAPAAVPERKPLAPEVRLPVAPAAPAAAAVPVPSAAPAASAASAMPVPSAAPMASAATEAPEDPTSWMDGKWVWSAGIFAIILLAAGGLFVYRGFAPRGRPAAAVAARQDLSPLSLRVERTAGGLLLTWNRAAQVIDEAKHATLSISDGDRHENYDMDIEQLRKGSIVYMPYTQDVSFRMEVMGSDQSKTASELVRVLRTSPMPEQPSRDPSSQNASGSPIDPASGADSMKPEGRPAWAQPVKPFNAASIAGRLRPARSSDLPEAPALSGGDAPSPSSALPDNLGYAVPAAPPGAPAMPPSAPAPRPSSSAAPDKAAPAPVASRLQRAELIYRRDPIYPGIAKQSGVKGAVNLQVTVGTDGRVKAVNVISGHPLLRQAAVEAVMQWVYKPTLLNGVAQESKMQVMLNFVGAK
jgi:TonB family protein